MNDSRGPAPSDAPPSSRRADRDPDVAVARGAARDGVGALHNLANLLRSLRVGAKPLARAIVDVRESGGALRAAFASLRAVVSSRQPPSTVAASAALFDGALAAIDGLAGALERTDPNAIDARARLSIEAVVRRAAAELDGVLCLSDLLVGVGAPAAVPLDLGDVVRLRLCGPRTAGTAITVTLEPGDYSFVGDAVVAAVLVEVALASVARARGPALRARAERGADGRLWLAVRPDEARRPSADAIALTVGAPVAAAQDVARAAARAVGADLELAASGQAARILL